MTTTYEEFLKKKMIHIQDSGFELEQNELNSKLFDFQKHIVQKALKKGRYAIFADTGLGKSFMQIEWAYQVAKNQNSKVLILAPLAVSGQTIQEAKKLGYDVQKIGSGSESAHGLYITNYEQIENIKSGEYSGHSVEDFSGIVLDESSILKNFTGKTKTLVVDTFAQTKYKLACTATPSPNDLMEIGNHSEFLNYMSRDEMLAMYFVHDGGETAKWRVKGHSKKEFYSWIGTWATVIQSPSDIGFTHESERYKLPDLVYIEKQVKTDKKDDGNLFNESSVNATDFNKELRQTSEKRVQSVYDIVRENSKEQILIWVHHNEEGDIIEKNLKHFGFDARQVKGSDSIPHKESTLLGFANNEFQILITKGKIAGMGLNFQSCHIQVFASLDFSFEKLYQSVRRSYRFGQKEKVIVYLITTDTMENVIGNLKEKEKIFNELRTEMKNIISEQKETIKMTDFPEVKTKHYHILNGDSCQTIKTLPDESIGFSVFSPPFADLYTYSDKLEDMGNSKGWEEFMAHFGFLIKDLYRVMQSGRNVAVHCMDLPIQKGKEGFIGLRDFSGMILRLFEECGFIYHSRVTIWKDPVIEMQRTKALGLLHKQVKKDSTMSRVGIPDYVLVFRKDGERKNPVSNKDMPVDLWQQIASPVWMDINYSNTLQFRSAREEEDEKHICPLQLETIERLIYLYSNQGDTVYTPFLGIGSEVYQAVKMKRYGIGCELKASYFDLAKKNLEYLIKEIDHPEPLEELSRCIAFRGRHPNTRLDRTCQDTFCSKVTIPQCEGNSLGIA